MFLDADGKLTEHIAQMMPLLLIVLWFGKIQTLLVPAHLGSPGKGQLNGFTV